MKSFFTIADFLLAALLLAVAVLCCVLAVAKGIPMLFAVGLAFVGFAVFFVVYRVKKMRS